MTMPIEGSGPPLEELIILNSESRTIYNYSRVPGDSKLHLQAKLAVYPLTEQESLWLADCLEISGGFYSIKDKLASVRLPLYGYKASLPKN